jgi:hypothetical protein
MCFVGLWLRVVPGYSSLVRPLAMASYLVSVLSPVRDVVSQHILLIMRGRPSVHCLTYLRPAFEFNSVTYLRA